MPRPDAYPDRLRRPRRRAAESALWGLLLMLACMVAQVADAQRCPIQPAKNKVEYPQHLRQVHERLHRLQHGRDSSFVVVHFGDSHIQLDHFSGAIRQHLQRVFGDCGDGILFPYSACKSVGPRQLESAVMGTWECNTVLNNTTEEGLGVTGYILRTHDRSASMRFKYLLDSATASRLSPGQVIRRDVTIWHGNQDFELEVGCMDCCTKEERVAGLSERNIACTRVCNYALGTDLQLRFKATAAPDGQFHFHGISFDTRRMPGIQYHHCGVVGAQFMHFVRNAPLAISQLAALHPDLVIFSYGSNESYLPGFDDGQYDIGIQNLLQAIRKEVPQVNFLFTTPPDTRAGGKAPINVPRINAHLRQLAEGNGAALWDLNAVMGGAGSIQYWQSRKLARADRLHFTRAGYKLMGDLFTLAFIESYNSRAALPVSTEFLQQEIAAEAQALGIGPPFSASPQAYAERLPLPSEQEQPQKPPLEPFKAHSIFHRVERGETLFSIARRYEENIANICAWNHLREDSKLKVGQRLVVKRVE